MSEDQIKVELLSYMGDDLSVVNAARVSFNKQSYWDVSNESYELPDKDAKLIHYLAKHKHYSPFGHCFASFRITAPIFVCRQLVKHEYLRMNEVSRRYVDTPPEFYTPDMWRGKAVDKKQGSSEDVITTMNTKSDPFMYPIDLFIDEHHHDCLSLYKGMLKAGVAPEQARSVLPLSIMTSWWWSGSMDAFANMCKLRLKEDTQYETRLVAQQISDYMSNLYPISWGALLNETD
ncbi:MAG: FAD-dependent thymidylate synthase [Microcystis sp. M31BS1]|uniref:FAD-dependent thymidylate synthase n=1 Tax=Microcystis sp. M31BS1 TaxID=2771186 RepID=UPI002589FA6A|nr:FAD-dependent thymidylate synthase [Microcystis sp. M31BS1]MCA2590189.1 FAD-dependent thymidylate synthase [Microcystis sp. M31BS1]